jgi:hypothetical protein
MPDLLRDGGVEASRAIPVQEVAHRRLEPGAVDRMDRVARGEDSPVRSRG